VEEKRKISNFKFFSMPNHIQNRLTIIGSPSQTEEIVSTISSTDETGKVSPIDFNKIIPMSEDLQNIEADGHVSRLDDTIFGFQINDIIKQIVDLHGSEHSIYLNFLKAVENKKKYGHASWYTWSIANWGTKWNAYATNDKRNTHNIIYFQTAWSAPIPVITELSRKFPNVSLILQYADEDTGYNVGNLVFEGGNVIQRNVPKGGTKEAYEMCFELRPDCREYYHLVDGEYKYIEEEEA
jgi:hypothetical protein